ncbi:MAG TPA: bifunctional riboflavin kinase/FAD synthetase [Anaerolineaceae bacterium]|nr:bifunctional riboflavin kinase/FAD synthetase [Anaerolineaceae bacterium]
MQHYRSLDTFHLTQTWAAIGSFDGVHRGHQTLLNTLAARAHAAGEPAVAITFFPHPLKVLRDLPGPYYLTSPEKRADLISELGIDAVVTLPFSREMANQTAEEFMRTLVDRTQLKQLWVGQDFALGRGREGNTTRLAELGRQMGYHLEVIDPVTNGQGAISSSQIRALLQEGDVQQAAALLGRRYGFTGHVIPGDARGRQIGFPTANLDVWEEQIVPLNGVYATRIGLNGRGIPSVTNIGVRPTFDSGQPVRRVEAHLLDFNGDLYGQDLEIEFVERLRPEQRFGSVQELVEQIGRDVQRAREVLNHVI